MARHTTRNGDRDLPQNPAYASKYAELVEQLIPKGAVQIDISFPPYWKAVELTGFRAIPLKRDETQKFYDAETDTYIPFTRIHWKNVGPDLECRRGPVDDGVVETVQTGRIFTTGAFKSLPLEQYFGLELTVICKEKTKLPPNEHSQGRPRTMWMFETWATPETYQLIESRREEDIKRLIEIQRAADRIAVEEMARLNAHRKIGSTVGIPVSA
jgi:hypothetical protein